jgi:NADPH2:quinone reductase
MNESLQTAASGTADLIKAVVVEHDGLARLAIGAVLAVPPLRGEISVRVTAISLNRGEVKRALTVERAGARIGWDFVGVVDSANGVAGAPAAGTRVVGALPTGAWAELINVPLSLLAVVPNSVSDAQAVTLPVAGLTALHALRKGGMLLGRKVLIDGATGGVGQLAIQLAAASGALTYAHVRQEAQRALVERWATGRVIVGPTLEPARASGPYDLILDSLGGSALAVAMSVLRKNGICVLYGRSESEEVDLNIAGLLAAPGASLQSLILFDDLAATEPARDGLQILLRQVETGMLSPTVGVEADWTEVDAVAHALIDRSFAGKAVLHVKC